MKRWSVNLGWHEISIAALLEPARLVGGDFYDAFLVDQDRLVLAIGDVSGKGISAAMFMVRVLTLLRGRATQWKSLSLAPTMNNVIVRPLAAPLMRTLGLVERRGRVETPDRSSLSTRPPWR